MGHSLAQNAATALVTVAAYSVGVQACFAQSWIALLNSALGHRQFMSLAAQAYWPAWFRALV